MTRHASVPRQSPLDFIHPPAYRSRSGFFASRSFHLLSFSLSAILIAPYTSSEDLAMLVGSLLVKVMAITWHTRSLLTFSYSPSLSRSSSFSVLILSASLFCTVLVSFVVSANLKPVSLFLFLPCLHVQQTIDVPMRHLYKQSGRCKAAPWQERCSFYLQVCSPSKPALWQAFGLYWIVGESADVWANEFLVLKMLSPTVSTCVTKLLCGTILNISVC